MDANEKISVSINSRKASGQNIYNFSALAKSEMCNKLQYTKKCVEVIFVSFFDLAFQVGRRLVPTPTLFWRTNG